jgi:transposase-like protein
VKNEDHGPRDVAEALRYFSDLDVATAFVARLRWPDGPVCPRCGGKEYTYLRTRRLWKCRTCGKQFSIKVGTLFEGSPVGLGKWLAAIWMIANSEEEISSYEVQSTVGVTQKTAWAMMRRIKYAIRAGTEESSSVEAGIEGRFEGGEPVEARNLGDQHPRSKVPLV